MLNKTKILKYLDLIKKSKKKCYFVMDLSNDSGIKEDSLKEELIEVIPMINFDPNINLKDYIEVLSKRYEELSLLNKKEVKKRVVRNNEAKEYFGVVDYIYRNMCDDGGLINLSYYLTERDIKLLSKLLKEEKERFKK